MDPKMLQMIQQLKTDSDSLSRLASSPDAQRLLTQIQQADGDALQKAAVGNTSELAKTISAMMQNEETAELIRRIAQSIQK